jgi:hypothetical protein
MRYHKHCKDYKKMPKSQEKNKDKLTTGRVKQIAAGIALTGALLGGLNALNNAENPVREVPRIESLDDANFNEIGRELHSEPGKGLFYPGQEITYLEELDKFDFEKDGHLRGSPVVDNGGGEPSNDVRIKGLQEGDVAYLSRPIISPDAGDNPNGTALITMADGHDYFVFENEARDVEALETVKSYPGVDGRTNMQRATVVSIHENGVRVTLLNADGESLEGGTVAVGVTRIGPELKP